MNKFLVLLSFFLCVNCYAEPDFVKNKNELISKIQDCQVFSLMNKYSFTKKNTEDFKFFLQKTIGIITGDDLYSTLEGLDYHFEGGENVPKKLFAPITSAKIIYTYIFTDEVNERNCIYDYYGAYFYKKKNKHWDFATIGILGNPKGIATYFSDNDFDELGFILKNHYVLEDINIDNQVLYSSVKYLERELKKPEIIKRIKDKCYGVYVFEKTEKDIPLRFTFCVNKDNYDEHAKYPNKFGRLVIERLEP